MHRELGAGKTVRLDVLSQHALGGIDGKEQLEPLPAGFLPLIPCLRSCQSHEKAEDAEDKERLLGLSATRRNRSSELVQQADCSKTGQHGTLLRLKFSIAPEQEGASDEAREEPERLSKLHWNEGGKSFNKRSREAAKTGLLEAEGDAHQGERWQDCPAE